MRRRKKSRKNRKNANRSNRARCKPPQTVEVFEFLFDSSDEEQADSVEANLRDSLSEHGGNYVYNTDDGQQRRVFFVFANHEETRKALASIDTTSIVVRRKVARLTTVNLKDVKPGPVRHQGLSEDLIALARFSYERIGHLQCPTFEQWELGFMRDMNPQREISCWVRMTFALERYLANHPYESPDDLLGDLGRLVCGNWDGSPRQEELNSLMEAVSLEDFEAAFLLGQVDS